MKTVKILLVLITIVTVSGCTCTPTNQCNITEDSTMITTEVGKDHRDETYVIWEDIRLSKQLIRWISRYS